MDSGDILGGSGVWKEEMEPWALIFLCSSQLRLQYYTPTLIIHMTAHTTYH